jgi:hypothetical protein
MDCTFFVFGSNFCFCFTILHSNIQNFSFETIKKEQISNWSLLYNFLAHKHVQIMPWRWLVDPLLSIGHLFVNISIFFAFLYRGAFQHRLWCSTKGVHTVEIVYVGRKQLNFETLKNIVIRFYHKCRCLWLGFEKVVDLGSKLWSSRKKLVPKVKYSVPVNNSSAITASRLIIRQLINSTKCRN